MVIRKSKDHVYGKWKYSSQLESSSSRESNNDTNWTI